VVVRELPFGRPLVGQARKEGFEVLNFQAENPERRATLVVQVLLHSPGAAARPLGKLVCRTTESWGAEVIIDGKNTGRTTPIPLTQALELPLGKHKVVFRLGEKSTSPREFVLGDEHRERPLLLTGEL
jgi:hypothetical protein